MLNKTQIQIEKDDKCYWSFQKFCRFSTKSFTKSVLKLQSDNNELIQHATKVCCKIAPPKVELLVWFLVLGKLNTKDRLANPNIITNGNVNCVLCNSHVESIDHLFFSCNYSWKLWCSYLNMFKVVWVMPSKARSAFESWNEVNLSKN